MTRLATIRSLIVGDREVEASTDRVPSCAKILLSPAYVTSGLQVRVQNVFVALRVYGLLPVQSASLIRGGCLALPVVI